jgi:hypothetical protein
LAILFSASPYILEHAQIIKMDGTSFVFLVTNLVFVWYLAVALAVWLIRRYKLFSGFIQVERSAAIEYSKCLATEESNISNCSDGECQKHFHAIEMSTNKGYLSM